MLNRTKLQETRTELKELKKVTKGTHAAGEERLKEKVVLHDFYASTRKCSRLQPLDAEENRPARDWSLECRVPRHLTETRTDERRMSCGTTFTPITRHFASDAYIFHANALGQGTFSSRRRNYSVFSSRTRRRRHDEAQEQTRRTRRFTI